MACAGCGGRRTVVTQVLNGQKPIKTATREIGKSLAQDASRVLGSGVKTIKLGLRVR